jgi:hypothetical protein
VEQMNKNMKEYIDREYEKIYKQLYIDYVIGLKNLNQDLLHKGLINSGISERITFDFVKRIIIESIDKVEKLFNDAQQDFKRKMSKKNIREYIKKSIDTIDKHLNIMEKEILCMFEKRFTNNSKIFVENFTSSFNNLKINTSEKLKNIGENIILVNTGEKIDINIELSVCGIIVGVTSLIVTVIFGILSLK